MPVAALIVVGPGIEVKAVEGDPLRADRDHGEERTHVAVEAIFVHAEIGRRVAQPDEARQERGRLGGTPSRPRKRPGYGRIFDHRRPI
jgi:hypothetical protein